MAQIHMHTYGDDDRCTYEGCIRTKPRHANLDVLEGPTSTEELSYEGHTYRVERSVHGIEIWDAEVMLVQTPYGLLLDERGLRAVLAAYYQGRESGERGGKISLQFDLLRALGVRDPAKLLHSAQDGE